MLDRKPRDALVVTILDENGSRQFVINKFVKKVLFVAVTMVVIIIVAGYFIMRSISVKLGSINLQKQEALSEYKYMRKQNQTLKDDIDGKTDELLVITNKIAEVDGVVSIKKGKHSIYKDEVKEVKIEDIGQSEREAMVKVIPSGNPMSVSSGTATVQCGKAGSVVLSKISADAYGTSSLSESNLGCEYRSNDREPIYATADGIVAFARNNHKYGYGNLARIVHVLGFSSAYAHLGEVVVKKGDFVKKGQIIAYSSPSNVGSKNISLYYEVRFLAKSLDTKSFIGWGTDKFESIFDSSTNSNVIDLDRLVWTLSDIAKLKSISMNY